MTTKDLRLKLLKKLDCHSKLLHNILYETLAKNCIENSKKAKSRNAVNKAFLPKSQSSLHISVSRYSTLLVEEHSKHHNENGTYNITNTHRLQHRCSPANFVEFLIIPILLNTERKLQSPWIRKMNWLSIDINILPIDDVRF